MLAAVSFDDAVRICAGLLVFAAFLGACWRLMVAVQSRGARLFGEAVSESIDEKVTPTLAELAASQVRTDAQVSALVVQMRRVQDSQVAAEKRLLTIEAEVKPNGGHSLHDKVDEVRRKVAEPWDGSDRRKGKE